MVAVLHLTLTSTTWFCSSFRERERECVCVVVVVVVLGIELRALNMPDKCFTSKPHPNKRKIFVFLMIYYRVD